MSIIQSVKKELHAAASAEAGCMYIHAGVDGQQHRVRWLANSTPDRVFGGTCQMRFSAQRVNIVKTRNPFFFFRSTGRITLGNGRFAWETALRAGIRWRERIPSKLDNGVLHRDWPLGACTLSARRCWAITLPRAHAAIRRKVVALVDRHRGAGRRVIGRRRTNCYKVSGPCSNGARSWRRHWPSVIGRDGPCA